MNTMNEYKQGRWARAILSEQHEDGSWGEGFHSMARPAAAVPLTTEQALRRLRALGLTKADPAIEDALKLMESCLRGERRIDKYWETGHDWALYTQMMLSCWIRIFDPDHETALAFARRWAKVISSAFESGVYDARAYQQAYALEFSPRMKGDREGDFVHFYCVNLLGGLLEPEIEALFVDHILRHPGGIYYLNNVRPLCELPPVFASLETVRYLSALQCLADYGCARDKLSFAVEWILAHRSPEGTWDLGGKAKDGIHLPLSDSWRWETDRRRDCTYLIENILNQLEAPHGTQRHIL